MNKTGILLSALFFFSLSFLSAQNPKNEQNKPVIALLGVFHFAGTTDLISIDADDLASPKRQAELIHLVELLSEYKPTKILVEQSYGSTQTDSLYQLYRKGEHTLSIHEIEQLGYRLANKMQHPHIYAVDHDLSLPFQELTQYLKELNQTAMLDTMLADMNKNILQASQNAFESGAIADYFIFLNSKECDAINKNMYLNHTNKMGDQDNPVGTNLVSKWWERNFRIMHNIDKVTEPGDRILVIFGQGHTAVLKDFYQSRTDVELHDIVPYLKR